ncbi:MAG: hypothetical protein V3T07_08770, partial [Myxococcota bacterium]
MSRTATHPEVPTAFAALRRRLRDVGLLLVGCTRGGELDARRARGEDWLSDLFCESPIFRSILRSAADEWSAQAQPAVVEAVTGLWLAPIPLISRRRRSGYSVVVILTEEFLAAEHLAAMCQASRMDRSLCQQRLAQLPPAAASEIGRLAAMARAAHDDQLRLCADRAAVESVGQQLAESYEEINLLYVIIQEMKVVERPERFVTMACQELLATLPYAWIGAQFADDPERLNQLAGRLIVAGRPAQPIEALSASALAILAQTR